MKTFPSTPAVRGGFTLIELTVVIFILIALLGMGFGMSGAIEKWKKGKEASETLRSVYTAQRLYLADHPTTPLDTLTPAMLIPYIPNGNGAIPTSQTLEGVQLNANVRLSPPVWTVTAGGISGAPYDPSGSPSDSLWDVGQ